MTTETLGEYLERQRQKEAEALAAGHACRLCGGGVTAKDPVLFPYCSTCFYTGAAFEDQRSEQLERLGRMLPGARLSIDHTGGGCFWLGVRYPGEDVYYILTDGEASLPEQAEGGWRYVGLQSGREDSEHYDGTAIRWLDEREQALSDQEAAELIAGERESRT